MAGIIFGVGLLCAVIAQAAESAANIRRVDGKNLSAREIDAEVQKQMEQERVPGLALALVQDGRPIYVKSYGLRSVEEAKPLEADTILYAASLTKLTFAYMVMQLVDEKKLDLDKPIATYLAKPAASNRHHFGPPISHPRQCDEPRAQKDRSLRGPGDGAFQRLARAGVLQGRT